MDNDPRIILPDDEVRVYDYRINAFARATVLRRYGYKWIDCSDVYHDEYGRKWGKEKEWKYPDVLDVRFHHDGRESCGHFTKGVEGPL